MVGGSHFSSQLSSPCFKSFSSEMDHLARPADPDYPIVLTTYNVTEHWCGGGETHNVPNLLEAEPQLYVEMTPDQRINAFLSGGDGQAFLYCGLCGHQWRFARNRCPVCETDDHQHLVYYQEAENTGQRINACHQCGHYLL